MIRKARILHIVGDSKFGGGAVIILRLAEMAMHNGWGVDILTTDPTFQHAAQKAGLGVVDLDVIWRDIRPLRDLQGLLRLYRFLLGSGYTLVHTHTSKAGVVGRLAAWLAHCPVIIHTVHGFAFHEESSPLELKSYAFLERLAASWCHQMVTVSEFHRKWALQLGIGDTKKIMAIPNGIAEERVLPDDKLATVQSSLRREPDSFNIIVTGRLAPQKGLEYLVRTVPILAERMSVPFRIVLAGDGPLRPELEKLVTELNIADKVIFLGFRNDIGNLLAACDIVVLPTLREGLSIALLEAMAAGKPIITTSIGSNREATHNGEAAILVPPKDVYALVEAIVKLSEDKIYARRLATRGREIYLAHYTEQLMLDKYRELYVQLLNSGSIIQEKSVA